MNIPFEIKSIDEEKGSFVAYGSTFENEDLGGDVMVKGAFKKSLEELPAEKVYMFYNHDSKEIIGEYTSIEEDEHGLLIEGKLFVQDIKRAQETYFLMKKGLINKFSIGYQIVKKSFDKGRRMLEEVKLIEVSPVTFPMNEEAELLGVKDMKKFDSIKDFENALCEVGASRSKARDIVHAAKSLIQCDAEEDVNNEVEDIESKDLSEVLLYLKEHYNKIGKVK